MWGGMGRLLMPDESEVHGLLAMMLMHDAPREARRELLGRLGRTDVTEEPARSPSHLSSTRIAASGALGLRHRSAE